MTLPALSAVVTAPPPDVEAYLWSILKDLGGVHLFTVDAQAVWPGRATEHVVQVDVRASSKAAAYARAWAVAQVILGTPSGPTWSTGVVAGVGVVSGPSWLPDDNGAPRYVARYLLTVIPRP